MSRRPRSELVAAAALAAILRWRPGLRLVGHPLRAAVSAAESGRGEHRPARVGDGATAAGSIPAGTTTRLCCMELLAPLQLLADEPSYVAAAASPSRSASAGSRPPGGSAGARTAGRGAIAAAAATAVATTHVAYSRMAVTDVALTLGITRRARARALGAARVGRGGRRARRLGQVPGRPRPAPDRGRRVGRSGAGSPRSAGLALGAFALTSPFVVLHAGAAWDDLRRVQRLARAGWLGFEHDPATPIAFADRLWEGLGPAVLVAAGGARTSPRRGGRAPTSCSAPFALVWALQLLPIEAHFDRYVLPLIPVLGAFAGRVPRLAAGRRSSRCSCRSRGRSRDAHDLTRTDTRVRAAALDRARTCRSGRASPPTRPRRHCRTPHVAPLELPGPGRPFDPDRERRAAARARASSYVACHRRDRRPRARGGRPLSARGPLLRELEAEHAPRPASSGPAAGSAGPWVALYRL